MDKNIKIKLMEIFETNKENLNNELDKLTKLKIYNTWDNENKIIYNTLKYYFNITNEIIDDIFYYSYEHFENIKIYLQDLYNDSKDLIINSIEDIIRIINNSYINISNMFIEDEYIYFRNNINISIILIFLFLFFGYLFYNYGHIKKDISNFKNKINKFFYKEEKNLKNIFINYENKIMNILKKI